MEININAAGNYLIHVLASVLRDEKAEEKPEEITFYELFYLARFHSVAGMACYGVERLTVRPEGELWEEWRKYRDLQVAKSFVQLSERKRILNHLTGKGMKVLPLKGCLLIDMYPQNDYREMADLDILIEAPKADAARTAMEELGYKTKQFGGGNHDSYEKLPYMNVELHRTMVPERCGPYDDYYRDVWIKAAADGKNQGVYRLSWDDYYIFMIVHFAKHYFMSGSGIRSIMDIHVFWQKYGTQLHPDYVKQELRKLNLLTFAKDAGELSRGWFEGGKKSDGAVRMAGYVLTSGTYGTLTRKVENDIRSIEEKGHSACMSRIIYFIRRCFLNRKEMYINYPVLKKYPVLLPLCWVHRWIVSIVKNRDRIAGELRALIK